MANLSSVIEGAIKRWKEAFYTPVRVSYVDPILEVFAHGRKKLNLQGPALSLSSDLKHHVSGIRARAADIGETSLLKHSGQPSLTRLCA